MWFPVSGFECPSIWRKKSNPERGGIEKTDGRMYWRSRRKNRGLRCEIQTIRSRTSTTSEQVYQDQTALRATEWTVIIRSHKFDTCTHFFISRVLALEDEQQQQQESVKRSGPPPRETAMELRAVKPLPKRRVARRTRSNSPPPVQDKVEVKRPRLSGTR